MGKINNSETIRELQIATRAQLGVDELTTNFRNEIIPVIEINPRLLKYANICKTGTATNATEATIYTTESSKDFYLCSLQLSISKDATSTSVLSNITAFVDGVDQTLIHIRSITLTAQFAQIGISFPIPIKIDRSTAIKVRNSTNVANIVAAGSITGYNIDNPNA